MYTVRKVECGYTVRKVECAYTVRKVECAYTVRKVEFVYTVRKVECVYTVSKVACVPGDKAALSGCEWKDAGQLEAGQLARTRRRAEDLQVFTRLEQLHN